MSTIALKLGLEAAVSICSQDLAVASGRSLVSMLIGSQSHLYILKIPKDV